MEGCGARSRSGQSVGRPAAPPAPMRAACTIPPSFAGRAAMRPAMGWWTETGRSPVGPVRPTGTSSLSEKYGAITSPAPTDKVGAQVITRERVPGAWDATTERDRGKSALRGFLAFRGTGSAGYKYCQTGGLRPQPAGNAIIPPNPIGPREGPGPERVTFQFREEGAARRC